MATVTKKGSLSATTKGAVVVPETHPHYCMACKEKSVQMPGPAEKCTVCIKKMTLHLCKDCLVRVAPRCYCNLHHGAHHQFAAPGWCGDGYDPDGGPWPFLPPPPKLSDEEFLEGVGLKIPPEYKPPKWVPPSDDGGFSLQDAQYQAVKDCATGKRTVNHIMGASGKVKGRIFRLLGVAG